MSFGDQWLPSGSDQEDEKSFRDLFDEQESDRCTVCGKFHDGPCDIETEE